MSNSSSHNVVLAKGLRMLASSLRKEAAAIKRKKAVKCAQVLTAAKGLSQFERILRGEL